MASVVDKELMREFDCVRTEGMEDFDLTGDDYNTLVKQAKLVAVNKKFELSTHNILREMFMM